MNALQLAIIFKDINKDAAEDDEEVIPFTDVEFYADQIYALMDNMGTPITMEQADALALEMVGLE